MSKDWAKFYSKGYDLEFLIRNIFLHLELIKFIQAENPKRVLEVGSGTGSMSVFLSYLGLNISSLDSDLRVLEKAKKLSKKLNGKVNFILANAFRLPFKDDSFDLVFHQGFLEHFSDEQIIALLDEQLRVSKVVVFSVPNNFYNKKDFGDERLLPKNYWDRLLKSRYHLLDSKNYNPEGKKLIMGYLTFRVVNNMYLAKIKKLK